MLKGANLKGGRRPSAPYWPAATDRHPKKNTVIPIIWILYNICIISINMSGLLSEWLYGKLANDVHGSEQITDFKGLISSIHCIANNSAIISSV